MPVQTRSYWKSETLELLVGVKPQLSLKLELHSPMVELVIL